MDYYKIPDEQLEQNLNDVLKMTGNSSSQHDAKLPVRRRFIPISYKQWFDSVHNKTKAFAYMSKESFKYYYKWCEYVSKTYA